MGVATAERIDYFMEPAAAPAVTTPEPRAQAPFGDPIPFSSGPVNGFYTDLPNLPALTPDMPDARLYLDPDCEYVPALARTVLRQLAEAEAVPLPRPPESALKIAGSVGSAAIHAATAPFRYALGKIPARESDIRHPDAAPNLISYALAGRVGSEGIEIVPNADPSLTAIAVPALRREIGARADHLARIIGIRQDIFERAPSRSSELAALVAATYDIPPDVIQTLGDDVVENAFSDDELRAAFTTDTPRAPLWRRLLGKDKPVYQPRLHRLAVVNYDHLPEHLISLSTAARREALEQYDNPTIRAASWAIDHAVERQAAFSPEPVAETPQPWWKFAPVMAAVRRGRTSSPATAGQIQMPAPRPSRRATRAAAHDPLVFQASYLHDLANESPF